MCVRVCMCSWGCAQTCVSTHAQAAPRQAQPPAQRLLTSRKQSCSSQNSGSLFSTVEMISSRVCAEAAQRVCVNFLNSGCNRRKAGCLDLPAGEGLPTTDTHGYAP